MTEAAARLQWHTVPIVDVAPVTPSVRAFTLRTPWDRPFRAGSYVDVRLTAPDGYQAQRSYSIASAPGAVPEVEIMIERLADGEVSTFFHDTAAVGDTIEMRGPVGGPFTWMPDDGGPLLLAGGGAGVVPLLSMLRARAASPEPVPAVLLYSAQRQEGVISAHALAAMAAADPLFHLRLHLTRETGAGIGVARSRIDADAVAEALGMLGGAVPRCFVCGATAFVGAVADLLVAAGVPPARIRTERFG